MEEKTLEMTMLFDFYGELLTEKQRDCFDLYYNDDLSLGEIAEEQGISRQGVRDNLVRAEHALREYEDKTGLLRRFEELQRETARLEAEAETLLGLLPPGEARELAAALRLGIGNLKG
ncbi:MAG: YlxM family DNA-binding protein [Oscillospiraceae bacterium]|nr:YlxM family DNA-binding protein [Oscillospiraceae bacterium]